MLQHTLKVEGTNRNHMIEACIANVCYARQNTATTLGNLKIVCTFGTPIKLFGATRGKSWVRVGINKSWCEQQSLRINLRFGLPLFTQHIYKANFANLAAVNSKCLGARMAPDGPGVIHNHLAIVVHRHIVV